MVKTILEDFTTAGYAELKKVGAYKIKGWAKFVVKKTKARKAVEAAQGEAETKHAARQANGGKGILRMSSTAAQHGAVTALAWAPDGQWLLSAGEDTTLRVFRARGGAAIFACAGHKKPVRAQNRPVELMR